MAPIRLDFREAREIARVAAGELRDDVLSGGTQRIRPQIEEPEYLFE
ncbi:MAG: hypothetical protein HPY81_10180 [Firmicutes bacterium]|nr:hypothetical protein [Bacillota bacterium]